MFVLLQHGASGHQQLIVNARALRMGVFWFYYAKLHRTVLLR